MSLVGVRGEGRGGFTLIEVLIVAVILGILAGIAIPRFKEAGYQADAAAIMADMNAIRLAAVEYENESGRFPSNSGWRQMPPELEPYLGDMDFTYKDLIYNLYSGSRLTFVVIYPEGHPVGAALQRYRRPGVGVGSISWTPTKTKMRLLCNGSRWCR